jgi:hypothetical protein
MPILIMMVMMGFLFIGGCLAGCSDYGCSVKNGILDCGDGSLGGSDATM